MKFMRNRFYQGLLYSILIAFGIGCAKENYLEVGKDAVVVENQGMLIRGKPTVAGKQVILVPYGNVVKVLAEGSHEKLYGIKSKWYRVSYGRYEGWMWGGLAKSSSVQADVGPHVQEDHSDLKE